MNREHTARPARGPAAMAAMAALVAVVSLGACSTPAGLAGAPASLVPRAAVDRFDAAGRVSARITGDAVRGFSGGFTWMHDGTRDQIELLTPTGQTAARISVTPAGAEVETADGRKVLAASAEQYLTDALGITLPVAALPRWMQAVPMPGEKYQAEADLLGRPSTLWQNGWQVRYTGYSDDTIDAHPTRMQLNWGDIEARLIIADWKPRP